MYLLVKWFYISYSYFAYSPLVTESAQLKNQNVPSTNSISHSDVLEGFVHSDNRHGLTTFNVRKPQSIYSLGECGLLAQNLQFFLIPLCPVLLA